MNWLTALRARFWFWLSGNAARRAKALKARIDPQKFGGGGSPPDL